jgi:hypothetical protein
MPMTSKDEGDFKRRWLRVCYGMPKADVVKLLGHPARMGQGLSGEHEFLHGEWWQYEVSVDQGVLLYIVVFGTAGTVNRRYRQTTSLRLDERRKMGRAEPRAGRFATPDELLKRALPVAQGMTFDQVLRAIGPPLEAWENWMSQQDKLAETWLYAGGNRAGEKKLYVTFQAGRVSAKSLQ